MTLIPIETDRRTIADRFRKAPMFAFLDEGQIIVQENPHKTSKFPEFFEYFDTLGVDTIYVKELGLKTFKKLQGKGIAVYFVEGADTYNRITPSSLLLLDETNASSLCTLGHDDKGDA
ncbi:MAG: hypothetical protein IE885_04760 [Campylobacterales bacterium]|nr:hypothetical protein [Campylobacterales bacterium]